MGSIVFLAIGVAVAAALLGSFGFQALNSEGISPFRATEEKCEKIAMEGYKFHLKYPESYPEDLPVDDMNRLLFLDKVWMDECVNRLPAASVFDIIQKVELDFNSEE